jgi:Type I phosphodiesterase / nucleotide pyrophosphatase
VHGPDGAFEALARADAAVGALLDAAGGPEEFLERYAVILCSDHGQTHVERSVQLQSTFADVPGAFVTASNRAGMVYRLPECKLDERGLAELLDDEPAAETVLFREGDDVVARCDGEDVLVDRDGPLFDYPDGGVRAWAALHNPHAGDLVVSAAPGVEFADLAGRHHVGGGSHGSLRQGDSEVPMLAIGFDAVPASIVDVTPSVLRHFGVQTLSRAA